jgi:hypothetical protein
MAMDWPWHGDLHGSGDLIGKEADESQMEKSTRAPEPCKTP